MAGGNQARVHFEQLKLCDDSAPLPAWINHRGARRDRPPDTVPVRETTDPRACVVIEKLSQFNRCCRKLKVHIDGVGTHVPTRDNYAVFKSRPHHSTAYCYSATGLGMSQSKWG